MAYDALLVVSFGGPDGPADVLPFLENVVRGRGVPHERLLEVAEHYRHFDGVSPINVQNTALVDALRTAVDLPVYWGNRNWHPFLADTVARMASAGVRHALAFVTSAYASYSSCRQYLADIEQARAAVGPGAPEIDKIRHFYHHPGFIEPSAEAVRRALAELPVELRAQARLVFTAHSIPVAMDAGSGVAGYGRYTEQVAEAARLIAAMVRDGADADADHDVVWQSRSGPPHVPWLEPDVNDWLETLAARGTRAVVVSPVGFVSDHVEVAWDLDREARQTAERLGMAYARAATVGVRPRFVEMIRELVDERQDPRAPRLALGRLAAGLDACPVGCCPQPGRSAPPTR
ncbi:MAG: ferrochelatase [Actinobacteria bacterium]|nr:ferrochelatase [Actinomycetota bacterium]